MADREKSEVNLLESGGKANVLSVWRTRKEVSYLVVDMDKRAYIFV